MQLSWDLIFQYRGCCAYCGVRNRRLTVDHVVPRRDGGTNDPKNILPACTVCNTRKADMSVEEFREALKTFLAGGNPPGRRSRVSKIGRIWGVIAARFLANGRRFWFECAPR